jgi:hypothetical protein
MTVKIKSETVRPTGELRASHLAQKVKEIFSGQFHAVLALMPVESTLL